MLWGKIRLNISGIEVQSKSTFLICCKFHWKWQSLVGKHLWFPSNVNPRHPITINRRSCSRTLQSDPACLHFLLKTTEGMNLKFILHVKDKPQQCQHVLTLWKKKRERKPVLIQKIFELAYSQQILLDTKCVTWWLWLRHYLLGVRKVWADGKGTSPSNMPLEQAYFSTELSAPS